MIAAEYELLLITIDLIMCIDMNQTVLDVINDNANLVYISIDLVYWNKIVR